MNNFIQTRTVIRALTLSSILAVTAYAAAPAAQATGNYDGNWSVVIVTEKGTCDRSYRYPVRITNGSVGYAGQASFNVSGKVAPNGKVQVTVSRGEQRANGQGTLSATDGGGRWTGGDCSGTWQAERRS
jgi:hypothetical protein